MKRNITDLLLIIAATVSPTAIWLTVGAIINLIIK